MKNNFRSEYLVAVFQPLAANCLITRTSRVQSLKTELTFLLLRNDMISFRKETQNISFSDLGVFHKWRHGLRGEGGQGFVMTVIRP